MRDWISKRRVKIWAQRATPIEPFVYNPRTANMLEGEQIYFAPSDATPEQVKQYNDELTEAYRKYMQEYSRPSHALTQNQRQTPI